MKSLPASARAEMGEGFRARDTRLNRDVAAKVLPNSLRHEPRFQAVLKKVGLDP